LQSTPTKDSIYDKTVSSLNVEETVKVKQFLINYFEQLVGKHTVKGLKNVGKHNILNLGKTLFVQKLKKAVGNAKYEQADKSYFGKEGNQL
jgi:hypothetical protein